MAHLFHIRPWEWDLIPSYGMTLDYCDAIARHREEMKKGAT